MYKISREIRPYNRTQKDRENHWVEVLKNQAQEFCLGTGLHGYKYIVQSERTKIERIIWGMMIVTSLGCAAALMRIAWQYNSARPTLTVIESMHHGIWNYPFPAVTICNINRVSRSGAEKFVKKLKFNDDFSEEYLVSEMGLLIELLHPGLHGYDVSENLTILQNIFDASGYTMKQVVAEVSQSCMDLVVGCKWKGSWIDCRKLFKPSMSRDGACCSFNYITAVDPRFSLKEKEKHVTACGYQTGLTVILNSNPSDYLATILGSYGMKVMLHYPYDYPDLNSENKLIGLDNQVFLSVSPEVTYSTTEVRALAEKTRECVFSDERVLPVDFDLETLNFTYAKYSYRNCLAACRATTIKSKCKCVPFYFQQQGTRICDLKDVACLKEHKSWFETSWPGTHVTSLHTTNVNIKKRPCDCMPDCKLYRYPVEGSLGILDRAHFYGAKRQVTAKNESIVHIFFSDLVSIQYRRSAYYNWRNLFASFGGLLGLFAGFSLMSAYELVYFFVIRVIADACARKKIVESADRIKKDRVKGKFTRGGF